jgi:phosphate-selective porin OprO and OprP
MKTHRPMVSTVAAVLVCGATLLLQSAVALAQAPAASEPQPKPVTPPPAVTWRDGKTRITTENAYLEISNRVQVRFTEELPDDDTQLAGTGDAGDPRGSFRIRRAKFKLEGWMMKSWLTYELQLNWPAVSGSNAGAILEDAAFDLDFSKGKSTLRAHVGQFKVPFGAQEMMSSGNQMFVDRALASNTFFRGRDTGIALWGVSPGNRLEWRVGMFNGNGVTRAANDNAQFQYNARVLWQPNGGQSLKQRAWVGGALYSESDFESTTTPIYAVAVNWEHQNNFNATAGNDQKWNAYSVDGIYKFKGFSANGMYSMARRTPETGAKFDATGGFIQAGMLFSRRQYEVAARFGQFDPSDRVGRNITKEARIALNYYYARHGLKWQSDAGRVDVQPGPAGGVTKTWEVRSQLQFVF